MTSGCTDVPWPCAGIHSNTDTEAPAAGAPSAPAIASSTAPVADMDRLRPPAHVDVQLAGRRRQRLLRRSPRHDGPFAAWIAGRAPCDQGRGADQRSDEAGDGHAAKMDDGGPPGNA